MVQVLFVFAFVALLAFVLFAVQSAHGGGSRRKQIKGLVEAQRNQSSSSKASSSKDRQKKNDIFNELKSEQAQEIGDSRLTLERKLVYAKWSLSPYLYWAVAALISTVMFIIVQFSFNIAVQLLSLSSGPAIMNALLNYGIKRRFKEFDKDFPQFLASMVGLLKTGMNPLTAIGTAARGLDEGSLVRNECELMLERLRYGVSEDQSIGSFGEDIAHAEIELFVQALLLSRQVGGTLSDTLDRLCKQVRRRQYFRQQAQAAVSMQRGSIWFIFFIMVAMEAYLFFMTPKMVLDSLNDPMGWEIWQYGGIGILIGFIWVRTVTKIKV